MPLSQQDEFGENEIWIEQQIGRLNAALAAR